MLSKLIRLYNVKRGYYSDEGKPLVCPFCNCGKIDEIVTGRVENIECETIFRCSRCGKEVGFWAYGSYDADYMDTFYLGTLL